MSKNADVCIYKYRFLPYCKKIVCQVNICMPRAFLSAQMNILSLTKDEHRPYPVKYSQHGVAGLTKEGG